ncbi:DUF2505 domain-containing protein [Xylanimonas oleitrophica]|uniref:DUF2505 domain-containing protein n=1 Tax=Xylanimonas oleitrophica TaxID=2607479 RepID=A0A2W5X1X1_9MICO|nr:DUF2505 domain-containing protein [Xylanimonas oleitrophica]PZR54315.1 DUF2505 domain-containing protein [Xylanimonas oleitrophica]
MHLTVEQTYPASVDDVAAMLADESFVRWRAERSTTAGTVEQADVDHAPDGAFTVVVRRTLPTDQIPAQVRPFVGERLEVRQAEAWEAPDGGAGRRVGTVALEITGTPVRLTGTVALEPTADGTLQVYRGEVKAAVPLFASFVEEAAAATVRTTLAAEEQAGRDWLAGTR